MELNHEARLKTYSKVIYKYLVNLLILFGFVELIEHYLGWASLLAPWVNLSPLTILGAVCLILISYLVRAYRVYDYFTADMSGRFALCLRLSLQHNFLNNILPMRSGELGFPVLMSQYFSIPASRSLPVLFWFRLLDLHTLVLLGFPLATTTIWHPAVTALVTFVWLISLWIFFKYYMTHMNTFAHHTGKLARLTHKVLQSLPQDGRKFLHSWFWTIVNWIIKLSIFAWVLGLFIPSGFIANWFGATMGDLTSILPIHGFAGIGTYEAGIVAGLLPFKVSASDAIQAAVNLHLFVLGCTLISGIISVLIPRNNRQLAANTRHGHN